MFNIVSNDEKCFLVFSHASPILPFLKSTIESVGVTRDLESVGFTHRSCVSPIDPMVNFQNERMGERSKCTK
jgi:hypothetical protein